ncbi:MAG: O-antigen ligase family protein [Alphaproteobacteria bacterium]|jgi:O-antigen ligase|nr:O-antigen ligase family protein [Alphaproteobacteria bacterium]MDP7173209.1 O-antigen ligase family protein [Alphaproteobacteria bacterium]MDP7233239.1 O-antigen ligase family protein [Alphaproteobacteria bacterium]MDP7487771.1 O-antigen ligase family protein [Alphaproteobacteria bacterium]MEE1544403.1 O-antigen ligase family protein [Alphaproteobacteria bacterium]|tara:strand:+ start:3752 stop:4993 length:1242 start_codon:yes stop_codon:yes gene_type:complete
MSDIFIRIWVAVLTLAAFLFAPFAVLVPKALAALALIAALAALPVYAAVGERLPQVLRWAAFALAAMLVWAAIDSLWAEFPDQARARLVKLAFISAVGLFLVAGTLALEQPYRDRIGAALCLGIALALAVMAVDALGNGALRKAIHDDPAYYGVAGLNRGATVIVLMVWPAVAWLWQRARDSGKGAVRGAALLLIVALISVLLLLESNSAEVAFVVGAVVFVVVVVAPGIATRGLAALVALGTMAAPILPITVLSPNVAYEWVSQISATAVHRIYIWRFVSDRILERRFTGWGLDASRSIPGADTYIVQFDRSLPFQPYGEMTALPLHPHNAPLQLWLELGLPGAALFALLCGGLLLGVARGLPRRLPAAAASAAILVAVALSSFSYGVWQTWWLAALWLAAAMTTVLLVGRK